MCVCIMYVCMYVYVHMQSYDLLYIYLFMNAWYDIIRIENPQLSIIWFIPVSFCFLKYLIDSAIGEIEFTNTVMWSQGSQSSQSVLSLYP